MLIVLAVILFFVDIMSSSFGVLTAGGLVAMAIGSLMLFEPNLDPAMRVSLQVIVPVILASGAFFALGVWLSAKSMLKRPISGPDGLLGQEGVCSTLIGPSGGSVFVAGTHWNAVSSEEIARGARVKVSGIIREHMTLRVKAMKNGG